MSPTAEQLFQSALTLAEEDRVLLIDALIAETALPDPPFDEAFLAELDRRSAEVDAGTAELTPWAEVKSRVRARLEGGAGG